MKTKSKKRMQTNKIVAVKVVRKKVRDNSLYFLFTASQVEEVLLDISVQPVPFAPSFLAGIFNWRGHVAPVLDIEERFGFSESVESGSDRFVVVRQGVPENTGDEKMLRCVLRVSGRIHTMESSASYSLVDSSRMDVNPTLVRGAYRYEKDYLIIPDLAAILQKKY